MPSTTAEAAGWPALPTETEIYILPDGRVVIADLPAELAPMAVHLGMAEPCALASVAPAVTAEQVLAAVPSPE